MSPPPLFPISQFGGDWSKYVRALYEVYLKTVVDARLSFLGCPVKVRFIPKTKGMGYGFLHLISEAINPKSRNEDERIPDLQRCERLYWVSWCIMNAHCEGFSYWENRRGRETHVVIWAEPYDFVVVLAKRMSKGGPLFYLLKTAYCLREHTKAKLKKERDLFRAAQNG